LTRSERSERREPTKPAGLRKAIPLLAHDPQHITSALGIQLLEILIAGIGV